MASQWSKRITTRQVTLAASIAAVYFVLRSIPTLEMIGTSGLRFTAGDFLLTTIALVCGLWSGMLAVLIGTTIAYVVKPPIFWGLDFLPGVVNVVIACLVLSGRYKLAVGVYFAAFLAFVLSPYSLAFGYGYVPYTWLHIIALIALLPPLAARIRDWARGDGLRQICGVGLLSFVGTMGQHLIGGLLYELVFGFAGGINPVNFINFNWRIIFWIYPGERLLIIAISTILALAVLRSLKTWHLPK
jgi:uncharacterized membrane protein